MMRVFFILVLALILHANEAKEGKLKYIIDGDTLVFTNGDKCRLAYIDAPESKRNKKITRDVANCKNVLIEDIVWSGRFSKKYLKSIMKKGELYQYDIVAVDRYKRKVCDIEDYNKRMVEFGFAVPYWRYIKSKKLKDEYQKLLLKAKEGNRGVWKAYPEVLECMDERR
jgi:endonuclease YncB( thermonuclease family)